MSSALMRGQFTRFSGLGDGAEFPDPFMDVASLSIPQNIRSALYWCEFIWNYHVAVFVNTRAESDIFNDFHEIGILIEISIYFWLTLALSLKNTRITILLRHC